MTTDTARMMSNESLRTFAASQNPKRSWESAVAKQELKRRDMVDALGAEEAMRRGFF
jgi:hypothetical protein